MRIAKKDFMSNNITGITGVCEVFTDRACAFIATWCEGIDECKPRNKWFSYKTGNKADRDRARDAAIAHRKLMLKEHYDG